MCEAQNVRPNVARRESAECSKRATPRGRRALLVPKELDLGPLGPNRATRWTNKAMLFCFGMGIDGTVVAVFEEMPLRIIRRKFFITFGK